MMNCPQCGTPASPGANFCARCGRAFAPSSGPAGAPSPPSSLLRLSHLSLVWDQLSLLPNFEFRDPNGGVVGTTQGKRALPIWYALSDEAQRPVLLVDGVRAHGLNFDFRIVEPSGQVLATFRLKSSLLSRKYGITVGGAESMLLETDATGHHWQIVEGEGGPVVATGVRAPALRTATTQIDIPDGPTVDRRIVLGGMILAAYLTTARSH
jgi:hypothetical protein